MKNKSFFKSLNLTPFRYSNDRHRHLRIADILASDKDDQYDFDFDTNGAGDCRRDDYTTLHCSSPLQFISRCFTALRRIKGRRDDQNREPGDRSTRSIIVKDNGSSHSSPPESEVLGHSGIDAPFNMGVAFGLLYLIVASKNEMTKMVELRKEMETLLQNLKEESRGKSCSLKVFENNDSSANSCLTTDAREVSNFNISHLPDSENIVVCDEYESSSSSSKCVTREQAICSVGMNELELELEAELQRLQLHLDMDSSLNHPQKQRMKGVVESASTISENLSFGEVIDPQEAYIAMHNGVSPIELERRLHELLEAKQQERIEELEAALECAKHKLYEKEREVSWWKDTACTISKHIGEPQRLRSLLDNPKSEHQRG